MVFHRIPKRSLGSLPQDSQLENLVFSICVCRAALPDPETWKEASDDDVDLASVGLSAFLCLISLSFALFIQRFIPSE